MDILGFLVFFCTTAVSTQSISLFTNQAMPVKEGERLRVTCTVSGDPAIVQFKSTTETRPIVYWITSSSRCDQILLHNRTVYTASCDRAKSEFHLDILCVSPSFDKNNITCEAHYLTSKTRIENSSIHILVNQRYPVCSGSTPELDFLSQNDCPVTGRNILIAIVVLLLLIQIVEFLSFHLLYRKGYILVNKKKRQVFIKKTDLTILVSSNKSKVDDKKTRINDTKLPKSTFATTNKETKTNINIMD